MQTNNNETLIRRMKEGDKKALEEIYNRYHKGLTIFGCNLIHHPQEVEDAIQDCFTGLWARREKLEEKNFKIGSYLFSAVRFRCANYTRRIGILQGHLVEYASRQQEENRQLAALDTDLMLAIDSAIKSLPGRLKQVFEAKHIYGYRSREIAAQTGLSDHTVKSYLAEAMKLLRAKLIIYVK